MTTLGFSTHPLRCDCGESDADGGGTGDNQDHSTDKSATDANGCTSNTLMLIMRYSLCCDCGVSDTDTDGLCDNEDNCINRRATNFADPANVICIVPGCMDADYLQYDPEATVDDGSCSTLVVEGCTDPANTEYDASANTDDGSCSTVASTCVSPSMDGYSYGAVEIGDQCWFSENLRTTVYADGTAIPEVTDGTAWSGLSTGARCDYGNDASNVATYGRLYNWYSATVAAGLCPTGWHVPTDDEWTALVTYLGANGHSGAEGTALKSTSGWSGSGNGTDDFGFSALPGG
ncbi:MAG: fibrobacter succinogenes major paralogous domain-containing protein, partial [Flavobacteriales bacterium]|nr:fibrobacter succinogenes major paralogous domain-containing protein [Flavobacteriales bacterium]